jgi:Asparagine synthase
VILVAQVHKEPGDGMDGLDGVSVVAEGAAQRLGEPGRDLLLFDGAFHPDTGLTPSDALEACRRREPHTWWRNAAGRYGGVYLTAGQPAQVFTDHAGIHDMYVWQDATCWAASDSLGRLLARLPSTARQLDEQAAAEFITLGLVLNGRTLARGVRRLQPGSHLRVGSGQNATHLWSYELRPSSWTLDEAIEACWELLRKAAARVRDIAGNDAVAKVGLSGGLDSRLTTALLAEAGMSVQPYFFGEARSDAASVASAVAGKLGLELSFTDQSPGFPNLFKRSLEHNPMADLEWCKYLAGRPAMAPSDVLFSGHLGDFLLGEWSFRAAYGPEDNAELARKLLADCRLERPTGDIEKRVLEGLHEQLDTIGGSVLQRKQGFWFYGVNMAIKQCGLFHQFGEVPHYSLFEDIDVINAGLAIKHGWRRRNKFYLLLFARHLPQLEPTYIRLENGSNDHKPLESWLLRNATFLDAVHEIADIGESLGLPDGGQTVGDAAVAIYNGGVSRANIHQFFRHLTIHAYQRAYC